MRRTLCRRTTRSRFWYRLATRFGGESGRAKNPSIHTKRNPGSDNPLKIAQPLQHGLAAPDGTSRGPSVHHAHIHIALVTRNGVEVVTQGADSRHVHNLVKQQLLTAVFEPECFLCHASQRRRSARGVIPTYSELLRNEKPSGEPRRYPRV